MPKVFVQDLGRKLALLTTYSTYKSRDDLANEFGRSWKTLDWWVRGDHYVRDPGLVPASALPILANLVAEIVPGTRTADQLQQLVLGPVSRLEGEIRSLASVSFDSLLRAEATGVARLRRKGDDLALVEYEDEGTHGAAEIVSAGELFRIEFPTPGTLRHAVALQNAQHVWAVLDHLVEAAAARVLVPGLHPDGECRYMQERRDLGRHQFVCLASAAPFPIAIDEHRRDRAILEKPMLDALADFYRGLPRDQRACDTLEVIIEPADAPA